MEPIKICKKCGASLYSDNRCVYCGTPTKSLKELTSSTLNKKFCHRCGDELPIVEGSWHNRKTGKKALLHGNCISQSCVKYCYDFEAKEKRNGIIIAVISITLIFGTVFIFIAYL